MSDNHWLENLLLNYQDYSETSKGSSSWIKDEKKVIVTNLIQIPSFAKDSNLKLTDEDDTWDKVNKLVLKEYKNNLGDDVSDYYKALIVVGHLKATCILTSNVSVLFTNNTTNTQAFNLLLKSYQPILYWLPYIENKYGNNLEINSAQYACFLTIREAELMEEVDNFRIPDGEDLAFNEEILDCKLSTILNLGLWNCGDLFIQQEAKTDSQEQGKEESSFIANYYLQLTSKDWDIPKDQYSIILNKLEKNPIWSSQVDQNDELRSISESSSDERSVNDSDVQNSKRASNNFNDEGLQISSKRTKNELGPKDGSNLAEQNKIEELCTLSPSSSQDNCDNSLNLYDTQDLRVEGLLTFELLSQNQTNEPMEKRLSGSRIVKDTGFELDSSPDKAEMRPSQDDIKTLTPSPKMD